jgi:FkbM family methyltransferase
MQAKLMFNRMLLVLRYRSISLRLLRIIFAKSSNSLVFLSNFPAVAKLPALLQGSQAQFFQDIVALHYSGFKRNGYFVEIGAGDGKLQSNTYFLEKNYNWSGILAEPNKSQYNKILSNRNCHFSNKIVFSQSNLELIFNETSQPYLSTIDEFSKSDGHASQRLKSNSLQKYNVKTISLMDLLEFYQSPKTIDYLSLDTEGSEYHILSTFNFDIYRIRLITVEHNFTENRSKIFNLLINNNYRRIHENISNVDDWYIPVV